MTFIFSKLFLSAATFVFVINSGCVTFQHTWEAVDAKDISSYNIPPLKAPTYTNLSLDGAANGFRIQNNSSDMIYVDYDDSFAIIFGATYKVYPGEVLRINKDATPLDAPIAPGTFAKIILEIDGNAPGIPASFRKASEIDYDEKNKSKKKKKSSEKSKDKSAKFKVDTFINFRIAIRKGGRDKEIDWIDVTTSLCGPSILRGPRFVTTNKERQPGKSIKDPDDKAAIKISMEKYDDSEPILLCKGPYPYPIPSKVVNQERRDRL